MPVPIKSKDLKHKAIKVQAKRRKRSIGFATMLASSIVIGQLSLDLSAASAVGVPSAPTLSATIADGTHTSSQSITFTYSGEAGSILECVMVNQNGLNLNHMICPPSPFSPDFNGQYPLSEDTYTFKVRQNIGGQVVLQDGKEVITGGTYGEYVQTSWVVDLTSPVAPVLTGSELKTSTTNSTASFTFTGERSQGFECSIDSATWEICQSPKSYSSLTEGLHSFRVRQTDLAGNSSLPVEKTWTINLTASPAPSITSWPTSSSSTSATFAFSGSSNPDTVFECKIDTYDFEDCVSPKSYSSLTDGAHTFIVRQRESTNGNVSNEAESNWTIDTTSPSVAQQGAPRTPNSQLSLVYTIRFSEIITGITTSDFVVAGAVCQVSSVTLSGTTYQVLLSNCADKQSVNLELLANSVDDAYGNQGPTTNVVFPTISIDTGYVESVYQAPYAATITGVPDSSSKTSAIASRTSQKNSIIRTAERFPLATDTQLVQIDMFETSTSKTFKIITTSEQPTEVIQFESNISPVSASRQFVTLLTVPFEVEGVAKFVVYRTSIPLLNPYLIM